MLAVTAPGESAQTVNTYDPSGRVVNQTDPDGQVTTYSYNGNYGSAGSTVVTIYPEGPSSDPDDPGLDVPVETTAYDYSHYVLTAERPVWAPLWTRSSTSSPTRPRSSTR
jgi:hypothetical protein